MQLSFRHVVKLRQQKCGIYIGVGDLYWDVGFTVNLLTCRAHCSIAEHRCTYLWKFSDPGL